MHVRRAGRALRENQRAAAVAPAVIRKKGEIEVENQEWIAPPVFAVRCYHKIM